LIAVVDVHYSGDIANAACVVADWTDAAPRAEHVVRVTGIAPYVPGHFYMRELPPIRAVLAVASPVDIVVIDGFVWLAPGRPGLGGHLYEAIKSPVVGVAKNPFRGATAIEVRRGASKKPLFVTAAGVDARTAAAHVHKMHGAHRLPTLIRLADELSRK